MALEAQPLFNFYFRYPWDENDFAQWQASMVSIQRGNMEGLLDGAVVSGMDISAVSGMVLQAASGIAIGPTGFLMVKNENTNLTFNPPSSHSRLDLICIIPVLTNTDFITRPTAPFDSVPLQTLQDCKVVVVPGTESATPSYPAKPDGAVVLAGVQLTAGMSTFPDTKYCCDWNKREIPGRNSNFQQNFGRYDDRLRPYVSGLLLGIKPSQLVHPNSRAFSYAGRTMPSKFPLSGGNYNHADTFLNFQTGAITGGDTTSSSFSPTIPSAGNFINVTIGINSSDTIQAVYGTQGTHQQCLDGISNQLAAGAGSVGSLANAKPIAIVTVGSTDGANITSIEYVDCRGPSVIGFTNPMTTLGDIIYGDTGGTPTRVAGNTGTTPSILTQTGTGSASAAPVWKAMNYTVTKHTGPSSGTYNPPAGCVALRVRLIGGGGGAGGCASTTSGQSSVSGGGGGGGYLEKMIFNPLASYAFSVGGGGNGGSAGANNGSNGSLTSFGTSFLVAPGGLGGDGGAATTSSSATVNGGNGGSSFTGGDITVQGGSGLNGYVFAPGGLNIPGYGGGTPLAPVGGGGFGSGGLGVQNSNGASAQAGQNGFAGVLIIEEFYA